MVPAIWPPMMDQTEGESQAQMMVTMRETRAVVPSTAKRRLTPM